MQGLVFLEHVGLRVYKGRPLGALLPVSHQAPANKRDGDRPFFADDLLRLATGLLPSPTHSSSILPRDAAN